MSRDRERVRSVGSDQNKTKQKNERNKRNKKNERNKRKKKETKKRKKTKQNKTKQKKQKRRTKNETMRAENAHARCDLVLLFDNLQQFMGRGRIHLSEKL
jgi:chromatin remodeling complex protein RSC6